MALLVWVNDKSGFNLDHHALYLNHLKESLPGTEVKTLILNSFENPETHNYETENLTQVLREGDQITHLFIASHGIRIEDYSGDRTRIENLGSFGTEGVTGGLGQLIKDLKPYLNKELFLFFEVCSTLEGTPKSALQRARALYRAFRESGVRELKLWGANQKIKTFPFRDATLGLWLKEQNKENGNFQISAVIATATALISYIALSEAGLDPEAGWIERAQFAGAWTLGAFSLALGVPNLIYYLKYFSATKDGMVLDFNEKEATLERQDCGISLQKLFKKS